MGKEAGLKKSYRHAPLHSEMKDEGPKGKVSRIKRNRLRKSEEKKFLDPTLSKKILNLAREQQEEIEQDENSKTDELPLQDDDQPISFLDEEEEDNFPSDIEDDFVYEDAEFLDLKDSDRALLEKYFSKEPKKRVNLADLIMNKFGESNQDGQINTENEEEEGQFGLDPKIISVYSQVGVLLSRYKSGKIPKAFKIIPSLPNWEELLFLTKPENWTPNAMYEATKILVSNFDNQNVQKFFELVLLDRVRKDIQESKKLHYHLYMALKKALYKPAAFFKGILFPLCQGGATLREASIVGSVIAKVSIPLLHSSAALYKICQMEYSGANSLFIRVLLDKKYALPYKVLDAVVNHFLRFRNSGNALPVLWHQSLLVFAQRYKFDISQKQKEALYSFLNTVVDHYLITPEIKRELQQKKTDDEQMDLS